MNIGDRKLNVNEEKNVFANAETLKKAILSTLIHNLGTNPETCSLQQWYNALSLLVKSKIGENFVATNRIYNEEKPRKMYYLSMEYLLGQSLYKRLSDLNLFDITKEALELCDINIYDLTHKVDKDAALGNGGLGRLAACFLDSIATHSYPGSGYGLRYNYGMFNQKIVDGKQVENPETWLNYGNPWEFQRPSFTFTVEFGGDVTMSKQKNGKLDVCWNSTEKVLALAWDMPITGYDTKSVANLRLWSAKSVDEFDLEQFNMGNYVEAVKDKVDAETLTKVLYPNDSTQQGQKLRLKQEYFFVSASIQDIITSHILQYDNLNNMEEKVCIQLNDTHPALAVAELMRLFVDVYDMDWNTAWQKVTKIINYTNHTLLPEALETWSIALLAEILPRHLQIIYEINERFLNELRINYPGEIELLAKTSIIDDERKLVRMSHLAIIGSNKVNGVAALHSKLLKEGLFADFNKIYPNKIINQTNGITPRRWLLLSNPELSSLINQNIGTSWVKNLDELRQLEQFVHDNNFIEAYANIKQSKKQQLANLISAQTGISVSAHAMFDTQVKRIHEYKRQLLNVLQVINRYITIKENPNKEFTPRIVIIAGKAAPGYYMAKKIIEFINDVAKIINHDPQTKDLLQLIFIPNYNVSKAEVIIPGSDLSEQISTAGTEASGTGNMKFALNGALTIGTLDGANVEILEEVGDDNIFIFGLNTQEVKNIRATGYNPWDYYNNNDAIKRILNMIKNGFFNSREPNKYEEIFTLLLNNGDYYLLLADFQDYVDKQKEVDELYQNKQAWMQKALLNTARVGKFSSDRTIHGYCKDIWNIAPVSIT